MTSNTRTEGASGTRPVTIAVDGPAASGKGTLARRLASTLGFAYMDTGLLYRAVGLAWLARTGGGDTADPQQAAAAAQALTVTDLDRPELRTDEAAVSASRVAAVPEVREALLGFQRSFAASPPDGNPGAVLDGRDIGSVICPDADVKLFITASESVRAARRLRELRQRGLEAIHSRVVADMRERDARDRARAVAPLKPAEDAFVIDTSDLDPDAVLALVLNAVEVKLNTRHRR